MVRLLSLGVEQERLSQIPWSKNNPLIQQSKATNEQVIQ